MRRSWGLRQTGHAADGISMCGAQNALLLAGKIEGAHLYQHYGNAGVVLGRAKVSAGNEERASP